MSVRKGLVFLFVLLLLGIGRAQAHAYVVATSLDDPSGWLAATVRWFVIVGVVLVGGASAFDLVVLREGSYAASAAPALQSLRRSTNALRRWGLAIAIPATVAALGVQAAAPPGSGLARTLSSLPAVVASSWGIAWIVRICVLALIACAVRRPIAVACLTLLALLTLSASGHAVAAGRSVQTIVSVVADWLHVTAVAVWAGGVAVFATALRPALASLAREERGPFVSTSIARFSVAAVAAVTAIVVTGAYASVVRIGSLSGFVGTLYGRVVLSKTALLLVMLAFAFAHDREGRGEPEGRYFIVTVTCEAAVMLVVLALSALLTGLPPPSST